MAQKQDLTIDQGTTFSIAIDLIDASNNPIPLTGFTGAAQMKKWYTSLTSTSFVVALNATAGSVTLSLTANATANIVHGRYVYDVDIIDFANNVTRVVEGVAIVTPGVTNLSIETTANTYNPNTDFVAVPLDSYANGNPS